MAGAVSAQKRVQESSSGLAGNPQIQQDPTNGACQGLGGGFTPLWVCPPPPNFFFFTFDDAGEGGGVAGDEELQLLVQVAGGQVDVPGADPCRGGDTSAHSPWGGLLNPPPNPQTHPHHPLPTSPRPRGHPHRWHTTEQSSSPQRPPQILPPPNFFGGGRRCRADPRSTPRGTGTAWGSPFWGPRFGAVAPPTQTSSPGATAAPPRHLFKGTN